MNPLLTFIASLIRHVIVTGLFYLITLLSLPETFREQVEATSDWVAPILVSFIVWVVLKYTRPLLVEFGYLKPPVE